MANQVNVPIEKYLAGSSFPTHVGAYVSKIIGVLLMVAAIASFVYLVLGGILWITAGGDKGKVEEARNRITNAIIGLTIVAVSWALFLLVDYFFGLNMTGGAVSLTTSPGSSTSQQGVCITADRCANGPVGSNKYCQNPNYTYKSFGSCGTNMVYCDCVVKN